MPNYKQVSIKDKKYNYDSDYTRDIIEDENVIFNCINLTNKIPSVKIDKKLSVIIDKNQLTNKHNHTHKHTHKHKHKHNHKHTSTITDKKQLTIQDKKSSVNKHNKHNKPSCNCNKKVCECVKIKDTKYINSLHQKPELDLIYNRDYNYNNTTFNVQKLTRPDDTPYYANYKYTYNVQVMKPVLTYDNFMYQQRKSGLDEYDYYQAKSDPHFNYKNKFYYNDKNVNQFISDYDKVNNEITNYNLRNQLYKN